MISMFRLRAVSPCHAAADALLRCFFFFFAADATCGVFRYDITPILLTFAIDDIAADMLPRLCRCCLRD